MRRRSRAITGWLTAALLLLGALVAASASALPEVGRCVARAGTGKYKDANCAEKAGKLVSERSFEFTKGAAKKTFTEAGGRAELEFSGGSTLSCGSASAVGEYSEVSGAIKGVQHLVITLNECESPLLYRPGCKTLGAREGEFVSAPLKGALGYLSGKGTKTPVLGQELHPEAAKGAFLEFECGAGAVKVKIGVSTKKPNGGDCVIGALEPVNTMSSTFTETFSGAKGVQSPHSFETAPTKVCNLESSTNGGKFEGFDMAFNATITGEEALEIKA
jgi:hypothetical protein